MIGIAFSVGFVFGPMVGAAYAKWSHSQEGDWFVQPALLAVILTSVNIIFVTFAFKESLPQVIFCFSNLICMIYFVNISIFIEKSSFVYCWKIIRSI